MSGDDPQTEKLRAQIREELGVHPPQAPRPIGRRRRIFLYFCCLTPFIVYAVAICRAHHFQDAGELWNWLRQCFETTCPG